MRDDERELFFEGLGNIVFRKNPRAKRLIIRVKPNGQVSVTIPYRVSYRRAALFVEKKADWILRIQKKFEKNSDSKTLFNEQTIFRTAYHKLQIVRHPGNQIRKKKADGILTIHIPVIEKIESQNIQEKIRKIILDTWREEAREILSGKLKKLAAKHNFSYGEMKIKNMRTRWGSCSKKNTINLNLHLVRLPDHLQDYILIHELVHTIHKNHGKEFWKMLNDITVDAKMLARELRGLNIEIW